MLPLHTILYPTDFSAPSEQAFSVACALAREQDARLIVVHVAAEPPAVYSGVLMAPPPASDLDEVQARLEAIQAPGVQVEYRLEFGHPAATICRLAAQLGCDLIVMGTHGRSGLHHVLLGSVAEQVVRRACCPVLTIHGLPESFAGILKKQEAAHA
jgi:nucleotide-binding universal stress UspA family protein